MNVRLPTWQSEIMAAKAPPLLRPVQSFATRVPDAAAPICLLSLPDPPASPPLPARYRLRQQPVRFPKSLLKTIKSELRPSNPVSHPTAFAEKQGFLRYPKEKARRAESLLDLDRDRVGSKLQYDSEIEGKEESFDSYRGKIGTKADLAPLQQMQRENHQLSKTLKSLTSSLGKIRSASVRPVSRAKPVPPHPPSKAREPASISYSHPASFLTYNREVLYNLQSTSHIPLKDVNWQRRLRKSPGTVKSYQPWTHIDPVLRMRTVSSEHFKRLFVSTEEGSEGNQSLVLTKYPYCRTCVTRSSPIRVRLD